MNLPTPVSPFRFAGIDGYVKRDELYDPLLSGNKFRKLQALIDMPSLQYRGIVSYGGIQSNAMLSIAALCKCKGWRFRYLCKQVPERLLANPEGNLKAALALGMQLEQVVPVDYEASVAALADSLNEGELLLAQGGADPLAKAGVSALADEIMAWCDAEKINALTLATPSGTGTTAYYLARALPQFRLLTTPVVGDAAYLHLQMQQLGPIPENLSVIAPDPRFRFATPHAELLSTWQSLQAAGIEFDLIYGATMWHALTHHAELIEGELLYIHSGGLIGNATMLDRYRHKGMI